MEKNVISSFCSVFLFVGLFVFLFVCLFSFLSVASPTTNFVFCQESDSDKTFDENFPDQFYYNTSRFLKVKERDGLYLKLATFWIIGLSSKIKKEFAVWKEAEAVMRLYAGWQIGDLDLPVSNTVPIVVSLSRFLKSCHITLGVTFVFNLKGKC